MKAIGVNTLAGLVVASALALQVSCGHQAGNSQTDGAVAPAGLSTHRAFPRETVTIAGDQPIPNVPGKRLVSRIVDYPPGGGSVSHRHAPSAFIYAYVVSGQVRSKVNDEPARVYRAGETWFESPGSHHQVSENASDTEPARLLAVLIVDEADEQLTIPDAR
jgi:quercetin dioxygenase-like cupin family protein